MNLLRLLVVCVFILSLLNACGSRRQSRMGLSSNGLENPENPYTSNFKNDFNDMVADAMDEGGAISPLEEEGFENAIDALEGANPQDEVQIPPELEQQLLQLLDAQAKGKNMDPQKMALMGKIFSSCISNVAEYAPQPGEPLIGRYAGECSYDDGGILQKIFGGGKKTLDVSFSVGASYSKNGGRGASKGSDTQNPGYESDFGVGRPMLSIIGTKFTTKLSVSASGSGSFTSNNWKGMLTDSPEAASGKVSGKIDGNGGLLSQVFGGVGGTCTTEVQMVDSGNPIPEKYVEGIKKAGQCFRKAMLLMSPVMDDLFKQLDPQMANLIKTRMLGL